LSKGVKSGLEHVGHVFGIGSPSKWAALHIGKPLAAGIRGGSSKASPFRQLAGAQIKSALTLAYSSVRGPTRVAARSPSRHATRGSTSAARSPHRRTDDQQHLRRRCRPPGRRRRPGTEEAAEARPQPGTVHARPVRRTRVGLG
jgi:hypothetical protein